MFRFFISFFPNVEFVCEHVFERRFNHKNESATYFLKTVSDNWHEVSIPLEQFNEISDWSNLTDISFILEAWNTKGKKGVILIDNISFSS